MVPKTVATDTKKGAEVKAHASKAPAKAAAAKATSGSSKKPAAQKQTSSAGQAAHGAATKKAAPHSGSKAASKTVASAPPKSATTGAVRKSAPPAKAAKAKTADKSRSEPRAPAKKTAASAKPPAKAGSSSKAPAAKAGASSKARPVAKAGSSSKPQPAAKASLAAATRPAKASSPARPGTSGIGLGHKAAPVKRVTEGYVKDDKFLASQRVALERERATYLEQAASLKAEAESLVEEMEPGDIQFDDESGEGGTVTVDRERDLALSAQALAAVEEIDHALAKMNNGTYGICENCGRLIPKARLEALPYARLCIDCKSGGLSRR
jgi:DnaK suppressor protein